MLYAPCKILAHNMLVDLKFLLDGRVRWTVWYVRLDGLAGWII